MTKGHGRLEQFVTAPPGFEVSATGGGGLDFDDHFARPWLRDRHFAHFELAGF